jgi:hypothetical protein
MAKKKNVVETNIESQALKQPEDMTLEDKLVETPVQEPKPVIQTESKQVKITFSYPLKELRGKIGTIKGIDSSDGTTIVELETGLLSTPSIYLEEV